MQALPILLGLGVWLLSDWQTAAWATGTGWLCWCAAWLDAGPDPADGEPMR